MRPMRGVIALLAVCTPCLAADVDPLSDAVVRLLDPQPAAAAYPRERAVCRTVLLREALLHADALSPQARALVAAQTVRPSLPGGAVPAGLAWVHGEEASRVAPLVESLLKDLGGVGPALGAIDVYLAAPAGAMGSVVWDAAPAAIGIALSPELSETMMRRELRHQLVHLAQLRSWPSDAPAGWFEGTAVYLSCTSTDPTGAALADAIAPGLAQRGSARDALVPELLRSRASLAAFLCEASAGPGSTWGLQVLDSQLRTGTSWNDAFSRTLASLGLGTASAFHLQHALWLSLVAEWDNGRYYSFAKLLDGASHAPLPAASSRDVAVGGGGHLTALLDPVPRDGGYWVTVEPDARTQEIRGAVVLRNGSEQRIVPIPRLADGTLRIGVPVRAATGALVVIANGGSVAGSVRIASEHDPVFPFALSSFTTESTESGILVRWTVAEERGLASWRVMRSLDPARGFVPVTAFPLPGRGVASDTLSYAFLDRTVIPGERYFYFLEGSSVEGLVQPSFVVSVTSEPR